MRFFIEFYDRAKRFHVECRPMLLIFEQVSIGRPKISASLYFLKYAVNFERKTIVGVYSAVLPASIAI